jgi:hypothetical protein
MFNPSQNDVRSFFCHTYGKQCRKEILIPVEILAAQWIDQHPEYHLDFNDLSQALAKVYEVNEGQTNPFLHLSMHLTISEQVSIDQPRGIRAAVERLAQRHQDLHEAHHEVMECLGEMVWLSQRSGQPPDGQKYLECVQRRAMG